MKKILFVFISFIFLSGCGNKVEYKNMTAEEAKQNMQSSEFLILDVRSNLEFSNGHIDNAVNVDVEEIEKYISDVVPDKERKIIVYCQSGNRSKIASQKLIDLGYKNVYNLVGGISEFEKETD